MNDLRLVVAPKTLLLLIIPPIHVLVELIPLVIGILVLP